MRFYLVGSSSFISNAFLDPQDFLDAFSPLGAKTSIVLSKADSHLLYIPLKSYIKLGAIVMNYYITVL